MPGAAVRYSDELALSGGLLWTVSGWLPAGDGLDFSLLYADQVPSVLYFETRAVAKARALAGIAGVQWSGQVEAVWEGDAFGSEQRQGWANGEVIFLGHGALDAAGGAVVSAEEFLRVELAPPPTARRASRKVFWDAFGSAADPEA